MQVDASNPGHPNATSVGSPPPPTQAQQWRTAVLWLGLTIVCCASLYPLTSPDPRWLDVLAESAHFVITVLRIGVPAWICLILARMQLRMEQRLTLATAVVCCLALYVWASPEPQWTEVLRFLGGGVMGLIWLALSITPWWVWRGALPGEPAQRDSLEERVHSLARASLWLFALLGLLGRTIPWFDGPIVDLTQAMHLGWSSIGAYALVRSVAASRSDLVARSMFALLVPISIFFYHVSIGARGGR